MADEAKKVIALRDVVKSAGSLRQKRKELENLRRDDLQEWAQNREFYRGNQWVYWNRHANQLESLGVNEGDRPRHKVRLTVNQITPGVQQLVAQKTKTRPVIRATPDTGSDVDFQSAQVAERLYEYWWQEFNLRTKLQSALTHAEISQGYWLITWDRFAGEPIRYMLNPQTGQPFTDMQLEELFREELQAQGVDPAQYEQSLSQGEVSVQVLDGTQVWLDPIATSFEDAAYAICRYPMAVDDVEARFGVAVTPDASTAADRPVLMHTMRAEDRPPNARMVYAGYFKPTPALPKGRIVYWIEGPDDILEESDWEFPTHDLPLVKFPGIERDGSALDVPRTTLARPLQKELNNLVSRVAMHANLTLKPQMMAPVNSLRQRLTDEPGAVFEYAPIQGLAPEWRQMPSLPGYVFEYVQDIQGRLDRLFNLMPAERSQLPPRADSGDLLELMQEAVSDQISPEIARMEIALALAGRLMAALAQQYYIEERTVKIMGPGGSTKALKFKNADFKGGFSFHAEAGSGLPRTRAGRTKQILEMVEAGAMSMAEAIPYLPVAGLKSIQAKLQASEEFAHRKIEKLLSNQPLNVPAMVQAVQQVQSGGMNPETGQPFMAPEEAIAFVENQALEPMPFEDLQTSMSILALHMTSAEFEGYPPPTQARFIQHFSRMREIAIQMQTALSGDPVKVTLGLSGTVGPTVAANILQQKGVQSATPDAMAEPPLETSVYDSMDKPDVDSAGNDPMDDQERLLAMEQAQQTHMMQTAKTAADIALVHKRTEQLDKPPAQAGGPPRGATR